MRPEKLIPGSVVILMALVVSGVVTASPWVKVNCEGQAQALLERVASDDQIALTPAGKERLLAHSIAVCSGNEATINPAPKKKGFLDFGDAEDAGKKAGNKRLNKY